MTKLVLTAVSLIALLTVAGCVGIGKGKGKAPPDVLPPVMTKGRLLSTALDGLSGMSRPSTAVSVRSAQCRRWLATRSA